MSQVLFYSIIALNVAGVLFALLYLITNLFFDLPEQNKRNSSMIKIMLSILILAIVLTLVATFVAEPSLVAEAMVQASLLYSVIGFSWAGVIVLCGTAWVVILSSKKMFGGVLRGTVAKLFFIALTFTAIALVLAWLFT